MPAAPRGESLATGSAAAARPPVPGTGDGAGAPRGAARARVVVTGDGEGGASPGRGARAHTRPRGGGGSGRRLLGRGRGDRPAGAELRRREFAICACVGGAQAVVCPDAKRDSEAPPLCVMGRGGAIAVGGTSQLSATDHMENSNANSGWGPSAEPELGPLSDVPSAGPPAWILCACAVWSFPKCLLFSLDGSESILHPFRALNALWPSNGDGANRAGRSWVEPKHPCQHLQMAGKCRAAGWSQGEGPRWGARCACFSASPT